MTYDYSFEVIEVDGKPAIKVKDVIFTKYQKIGKVGEIAHILGLNIDYEEPTIENPKYDGQRYSLDEPRIFSSKKSGCKSYNHWLYKKLGNILQVSPSRFRSMFNSLMYKVFVSDLDQHHVKKFALNFRKKGYINPGMIQVIRSNSKLLDDVKSDGIYNIAPYVLHFGESPAELKKKLGKGLWKDLTKNSFGRNKLILESSYRSSDPEYLRIINKYPTTLLDSLGKLYEHDTRTLDYLVKNCKGEWSNAKKMQHLRMIVTDTYRMADKLEEKVSINWSEEKMQKKHDEFAKRIARLKYDASEFKWLGQKGTVYSLSKDEYTATLLTSEQLIAEEGEVMGHCVGGYARYSSQGSYAVYSVKKNDEHYSTIGFRRDALTHRLMFEQHYVRFNRPVECEVAKQLPGLILQKNNELLSKKT